MTDPLQAHADKIRKMFAPPRVQAEQRWTRAEAEALRILDMFAQQRTTRIMGKSGLTPEAIKCLERVGVSVKKHISADCHCAMLQSCDVCNNPFGYTATLRLRRSN